MKNYMEIAVDDYLDEMLAEADICKCDKCRMDIKSIALNSLKPHYVVTDTGALYAKMMSLESQHTVDIMAALMGAIQKVKSRPQH